MTKQEYMEKNNIGLREVSQEDYDWMEQNHKQITDYMYFSNYIITYKGEEWFSKNGSLQDMKDLKYWVDGEE